MSQEVEELEEYEQEDLDYDSEVDRMTASSGIEKGYLPSRANAASVMNTFNKNGSIRTKIKATKSNFVHNLIHLDGHKFDFTGRDYLRPIYDRGDKDILLKTARQVEKCEQFQALIHTPDGNRKQISSLVPGDKVLYLDDSLTTSVCEVKASESNGIKPCLRLETSKGSVLLVTYNHPLYKKISSDLGIWCQASDLKEGDLVASCRGGGSWDTIIKKSYGGEHLTWGIETETNTYISDFIRSHNTTYLANNIVVNSVVTPYNKSLYVSPSHMQTRQFSSEKLKPAIEKSPLIKTYFQDSSVSQQVFEKGFTNGSFSFLRSAFRSADRCLAEDTLVYLSDGSAKEIKDINVGDSIVSYGVNGVGTNKVLGKLHTGFNPLHIIELSSGHKLSATANHKFVTDSGEKEVSALNVGDYIPLPLNYLTPATSSIDGDCLVGLMLGDGCLNPSRPSFCNNDLDLINLFIKECSKYGIDCRKTSRIASSGKTNYTVYPNRDKFNNQIKHLGILGTNQFNKFIPEEFFKNSISLRTVLRGLFSSDGWVTFNLKSRQCEVGFVTGSYQLAKDVHRGLQSLGVYSQLITNKPRGRSKSYFYTIKIRNTDHIIVFSNCINFLCDKSKKLKDCTDFIINNISNLNTRLLPAREDCYKALLASNISLHSLWKDHKISFRNNGHTRKTISFDKVKKIYELTGDINLEKWFIDNIVWVSISGIFNGNYAQTLDIEIENDHTFCANGMITHNSRGISARDLALDEIQDLLISDIPVIMECTSHFPDSSRLLAGTPKSFDNPIEVYWQQTTQNEWLVRCDSCNHWNFLDETNIAPTEWYTSGKVLPGPVCSKCMKHLRVAENGRWMSLNPGKSIQGYRIPQLMVPWIISTMGQWARLLWKRDNYPHGQFCNEVLGLSYDSSSKPISRRELIAACGSDPMWPSDNYPPQAIQDSRGFMLTAGVDWGEGNDGSEKSPSGKIRSASYTVLTIGYYKNPKVFKVVLMKKYTGKEVDPEFVVNDIVRICRELNVQRAGVDWGHGWGVNNILVRKLTMSKVMTFQYVPKQKQRLKWDHLGSKFILLRNMFVSELFYDMKNGHIEFPKWSDFEPFAKDVLGIYSEYNEYTREIRFDHRSSDPDDSFHSILYAKLAGDIFLGKTRAYTERND